MKKVLVANRGEIALRVMRTCREMGLSVVAVASEYDRSAPFAKFADELVLLGSGPTLSTYLDQDLILNAARATRADAIHPGYGFLSENAAFARRTEEAGLTFIGPRWQTMELMGLKREAKLHMEAAGVPVVPGYSGSDQDVATLTREAERIGFPILVKASAGGGGKGMRVVHEASAFAAELQTAKREASAAFGNDAVILERYLADPRHVEFQVFGDGTGRAIHLFERECSIQRRHQKIIEEAPSPALNKALRQRMAEAAVRAAESVNYLNAGTIEFLVDADGSFYFLEMNTRLQVEHPITEMITGFDLVRWQIEIAKGNGLPQDPSQITCRGHAIECRIYAEDPANSFLPQTGYVARYVEPKGWGVRMDSGIEQGSEVGVHYDPLLAKLIAFGASREEARSKMIHALGETVIHGVKTNISFLRHVLAHAAFEAGETTTHFLQRHDIPSNTADTWCAAALTAMGQGEHGAHVFSSETSQPGPWERMGQWRLNA
ncbi:MAG: acetyl-CoA carboxylase biotin carboxylase subunit [Acidobacteria bacterium]|nr:acetyl-CoA carboxylase biotin carboxylase subunit [Acidobacteriota bacterium]